MLHKILYRRVLIFLCCFLAACHNNETNHKINDTRLKSAVTVIPSMQLNPSKTIAENISIDSSYSILAKSLKSTDLFELLSKPGPFTIFAPSNTAFEKLPSGTLESLTNDRKNDLENILSYHVVAGSLPQYDLEDGQKLKTLAGEEIIVTKRNDQLLVNGIKVNTPDVGVSNGRIYIIDGLLFPRNQNPGAY